MQLLEIKETTTLSQLSEFVGERNVSSILAANGLTRSPKVGKAYKSKIASVISSISSVVKDRKVYLLNTVTSDSDIFESLALQDENGWKQFSATGSLPNTLAIPSSITLPNSVGVLGNGISVSNLTYTRSIESLKNIGTIDPSIFNDMSAVQRSAGISPHVGSNYDMFSQWFKLPWGQITLQSSIRGEAIDFPVYPEVISDGVAGNYTTMPDMLYQYEPWQVYESSGPRALTYSFHFHRDMWSGNHLDGKANELIRFCEANCYPEYRGSAVIAPQVTLYIAGAPHITGVMTQVTTDWSGPLGRDGFYLECTLQLSITEVSDTALNFTSVKNKGLIG